MDTSLRCPALARGKGPGSLLAERGCSETPCHAEERISLKNRQREVWWCGRELQRKTCCSADTRQALGVTGWESRSD